MQDKNKMRGGVSDKSRIADSIKPSPGVYGNSPFAPFNQYPQTQSPIITPTKFQETGIGTAKTTTNQLRGGVSNDAMKVMQKNISKPSSSNAKTSKNKYRSGRTMKNMKDSI